jgi:hypothetical protein
MEQNYFQFNQQYYKQTEGLAMGAPTSAILAETYIQHMEHKHIYPILINHKITGYFRYVDDILIIYNQNQTNIEETINEFNKLNNNIKFTIEKEHDNSINFLDITIYRKNTKMELVYKVISSTRYKLQSNPTYISQVFLIPCSSGLDEGQTKDCGTEFERKVVKGTNDVLSFHLHGPYKRQRFQYFLCLCKIEECGLLGYDQCGPTKNRRFGGTYLLHLLRS